jgi:hypothetical protein
LFLTNFFFSDDEENFSESSFEDSNDPGNFVDETTNDQTMVDDTFRNSSNQLDGLATSFGTIPSVSSMNPTFLGKSTVPTDVTVKSQESASFQDVCQIAKENDLKRKHEPENSMISPKKAKKEQKLPWKLLFDGETRRNSLRSSSCDSGSETQKSPARNSGSGVDLPVKRKTETIKTQIEIKDEEKTMEIGIKEELKAAGSSSENCGSRLEDLEKTKVIENMRNSPIKQNCEKEEPARIKSTESSLAMEVENLNSDFKTAEVEMDEHPAVNDCIESSFVPEINNYCEPDEVSSLLVSSFVKEPSEMNLEESVNPPSEFEPRENSTAPVTQTKSLLPQENHLTHVSVPEDSPALKSQEKPTNSVSPASETSQALLTSESSPQHEPQIITPMPTSSLKPLKKHSRASTKNRNVIKDSSEEEFRSEDKVKKRTRSRPLKLLSDESEIDEAEEKSTKKTCSDDSDVPLVRKSSKSSTAINKN